MGRVRGYSPDAWLWHRYDLCDALGEWESSKDASFGLRENGQLLAVMPLRVISIGVCASSRCVMGSRWGGRR